MEITDSARNRMFSNKDLVRLIIPLIIEQMLTVTVGLADSIMTANVGEEAVSGVSLVDSVICFRHWQLEEPSLQGSFSDREKISWHVRQQTS